MGVFSLLFAAPFINIWAFYLMSLSVGWGYTGLIFGVQVMTAFLQRLSGKLSKRFKRAEADINDNRLKLINDMVVGCRTLKCYGWENHYIEKVNKVRNVQMKAVTKLMTNELSNLAFLNNMGMVAIVAVVTIE